MNKLIFSCLCMSIISSCKESTKSDLYFTDIKVEERASDFKLPKKIFDEIETEMATQTVKIQPLYLFSPIQVVLFSDHNNVIKNSPIRISFPNGGGKVDLKDFVIGQGSFYISFPHEQFEQMPHLENLYFISDTAKKKIDSEDFGLGCGKFLDIKNHFEDIQKINFLKLNTTEQRYLYTSSGYYIFVFKNNNQVYLSHVYITDSRHTDIFCSTLYKQ